MIPSRVTLDRVDIQIPWMLMRSTLSRLAKEKGHRVRVMDGCFKCGGAHFQRDCNARKSTDKQSSGKGKQSKSWSKSEDKGKSKENKGKSKGTKGAKGSHKGKTSKTGLSGLEKLEIRGKFGKLSNVHRRVPLTLPGTMVGIVTNGTMAGVLMNGMMTGALLDGTKVGSKRMTLPQAHFRLEVSMSVPRVVRSGLNG